MRTTRIPNTPGFVGYLFAFAIGTLVFALVVSPTADRDRVGAGEAVAMVVFMIVYGSLYTLGMPLLLAGLVLGVALSAVRGFERQRTHVYAAAATAFLFALPVSAAVETWPDRILLVLTLPASMALGRAAVIPFVVDRRARAGC